MNVTRNLRIVSNEGVCRFCGRDMGDPEKRIWRVEEEITYERPGFIQRNSPNIVGGNTAQVEGGDLTKAEALAVFAARVNIPPPAPEPGWDSIVTKDEAGEGKA